MSAAATRSSLSKIAYDKIKKMILNMDIKPGERIPEDRVAGFVGGSRTPVREALQALSREGLVNIYPRRYSEVALYDAQAVREVGVLRLSQDFLSCQLAMLYGTEGGFRQLRELARECEEGARSGNIYDRISYDSEFHLQIARMGGNRQLIRRQEELYLKIHLIQISKYTGVPDSLLQIRHHREIIEALEMRDYPRLADCLCDHLQQFYMIDAEILRFYRKAPAL